MIKFRSFCAKFLLRLLNTDFLNNSPCRYEYVGNVDAFSRSFLDSSDRQQPGLTVRQVLDAADMFKCCPINKNGLTVMEADGTTHEATVWDRHELNIALTPKTNHPNQA